MTISGETLGRLGIVRPGGVVRAVHLPALTRAVETCRWAGARAFLFDLSQAPDLQPSGLATLLELAARRIPANLGAPVGLCGLSDPLEERLRSLGLGAALPCFGSFEAASAAPVFRAARLAGMRLVIPSGLAPTAFPAPARPMVLERLDILGRSLAEAMLEQAAGWGFSEVIVLTEGASRAAWNDLGSGARPGVSHRLGLTTWCVQAETLDGSPQALAGSHPEPGFASPRSRLLQRLAELDRRHGVLDGDICVLPGVGLYQGDPVTSLDAACPDAVLAGGAKDDPVSRDGETLVSPVMMNLRDMRADGRPMHDALERSPHGKPQAVDAPEPVDAPDVFLAPTDPGSLFGLVERVLAGHVPHVEPRGVLLRDGIWVEEGGTLMSDDIEGPCWVGAGASVARETSLRGGVVIGRGGRVSPQTFLRRSILLPGVAIERGDVVDHRVVATDWTTDHRLTRMDRLAGGMEPFAASDSDAGLGHAERKAI